MTKIITPIPLTQKNFAPFGDVIEASGDFMSINYGQTDRYNDLARIETDRNGGRTLVNIFRTRPIVPPIKIEVLERHPLSSQAFMPLGQNPYLVVVAPSGPLEEEHIKVFQATANQGVNYHKGTWHHFSLALGAKSDFLVIDRAGPEDNCDEVRLKNPFFISPSANGA